MNKIALLFLLLFLACSSWANRLPDALAVPGGIVKIPLTKIATPAPQVFFADARVLVAAGRTHWVAVVGIPLAAKLGEHKITVKSANQSYQRAFTISHKNYPTQRISISKKRMVSGFTEQDLKQINADQVLTSEVKKTWTEQAVDADFMPPVDGRLSSLFGLKRLLNALPKRPHNGLDIAAPTGTLVVAPAPAKVINTGHYYFNGNTVFLDHGQGLLSAYLHLDKITVRNGQLVTQGEPLGTVGETGRVSGPHLHWIVYLNKTFVDPALFISKDIARLDAKNKKQRE